MQVYLYSFSRCWLPNIPTSTKFRENLILQQFEVIQGRWFWYQSKAHVPVPILVLSCTVSEIRRLIGEKCVFFIPLSYSAPSLPMFLLEFRAEVKRQETRVMGLLCGEGWLWLIHPCDRQTDGRTDGQTDALKTDKTGYLMTLRRKRRIFLH